MFKSGRFVRHVLFIYSILLLCSIVNAQDKQVIALNTQIGDKDTESVKQVKRFSNSESPDISFNISTSMKDCKVQVITNYSSAYKIRFIDYWGKSVKVYKNLDSGIQIDVSEFKEQIVILNIHDNKSNKLLSSQVVNLKRRNYH